MKKNKIIFLEILILFLAIFNVLELKAQNSASTIGLIGGYAQDGYAINVNYNYYVNNRDYFQGAIYTSFSYQKESGIYVPYDIISTNFGYYKQILSNRFQTFNINIGGGGLLGYEVINKGKSTLKTGAVINNTSKLIYGGFASLEVEAIITNHWSFIAKFSQYYHINSDLGKTTLFAGAGFRYFLFY